MKKFIFNPELKQKKWCFYSADQEKAFFMAQKLNIPVVVAQILINRGIDTVEEGEDFLRPGLSRLHSPFLMQGMDCAVEAILKTRQQGQKIAIYGDYDADGMAATALLSLLLGRLGADVISYIPNRLTEGYGLNKEALDFLRGQSVSLIITVDCGISDREELCYAHELGMEVIVTDHHEPPATLPPALALLNPLRPGCGYPFKDLCGAGVAFKLGQALASRAGLPPIWEYLDLVTIGTVADVVPLVGENRIFVAEGLLAMGKNLRPGLKALCQVAGLNTGQLTAEKISFVLAPRLNAAGRLGDPSCALSLLLETDPQVALEIAQKLQEINLQRRKLEKEIMVEACQMVEESGVEDVGNSFLLLARENWHLGVLGIVASRVAEKYNLPTILISLEDGQGKGSGRSARSFDLVSALQQCSTLLEDYGGHQAAAGLTIKEELIPFLRKKLNVLARVFLKDSAPAPAYYIDSKLNPGEITPGLVRLLEDLEPFGHGNPRPLFYGEEWLLAQKKEVGKDGRHLRLTLNKNNIFFAGISFNGKNKLPQVIPFREINFLFAAAFDRWRGGDALQLEIYNFFYSDEHVYQNMFLIDRRGLRRKIPYLRELLKTGEGILVFVNTMRRFERLQSLFSGSRNIFFSHQGKLAKSNFAPYWQHLVLYDLPLRENKLVKMLQCLLGDKREKPKFKIHLIYGEKDFEDNLKLLSATIPSFFSMEHIYSSLEEIAAGESVALGEAYQRLPGVLPFSTTRHLLEQSMLILKKACYIDKKNKDELSFRKEKTTDYCSFLNEIGKVDDFRKERERWEKTFFWQQYLLKARREEIAKRLLK